MDLGGRLIVVLPVKCLQTFKIWWFLSCSRCGDVPLAGRPSGGKQVAPTQAQAEQAAPTFAKAAKAEAVPSQAAARAAVFCVCMSREGQSVVTREGEAGQRLWLGRHRDWLQAGTGTSMDAGVVAGSSLWP